MKTSRVRVVTNDTDTRDDKGNVPFEAGSQTQITTTSANTREALCAQFLAEGELAELKLTEELLTQQRDQLRRELRHRRGLCDAAIVELRHRTEQVHEHAAAALATIKESSFVPAQDGEEGGQASSISPRFNSSPLRAGRGDTSHFLMRDPSAVAAQAAEDYYWLANDASRHQPQSTTTGSGALSADAAATAAAANSGTIRHITALEAECQLLRLETEEKRVARDALLRFLADRLVEVRRRASTSSPNQATHPNPGRNTTAANEKKKTDSTSSTTKPIHPSSSAFDGSLLSALESAVEASETAVVRRQVALQHCSDAKQKIKQFEGTIFELRRRIEAHQCGRWVRSSDCSIVTFPQIYTNGPSTHNAGTTASDRSGTPPPTVLLSEDTIRQWYVNDYQRQQTHSHNNHSSAPFAADSDVGGGGSGLSLLLDDLALVGVPRSGPTRDDCDDMHLLDFTSPEQPRHHHHHHHRKHTSVSSTGNHKKVAGSGVGGSNGGQQKPFTAVSVPLAQRLQYFSGSMDLTSLSSSTTASSTSTRAALEDANSSSSRQTQQQACRYRTAAIADRIVPTTEAHPSFSSPRVKKTSHHNEEEEQEESDRLVRNTGIGLNQSRFINQGSHSVDNRSSRLTSCSSGLSSACLTLRLPAGCLGALGRRLEEYRYATHVSSSSSPMSATIVQPPPPTLRSLLERVFSIPSDAIDVHVVPSSQQHSRATAPPASTSTTAAVVVVRGHIQRQLLPIVGTLLTPLSMPSRASGALETAAVVTTALVPPLVPDVYQPQVRCDFEISQGAAEQNHDIVSLLRQQHRDHRHETSMNTNDDVNTTATTRDGRMGASLSLSAQALRHLFACGALQSLNAVIPPLGLVHTDGGSTSTAAAFSSAATASTKGTHTYPQHVLNTYVDPFTRVAAHMTTRRDVSTTGHGKRDLQWDSPKNAAGGARGVVPRRRTDDAIQQASAALDHTADRIRGILMI